MKTLSAIILLGLSIGLAHQADAEPFNDRGPLWSEVAPAGSDRPPRPARPELDSFNARGMLWSEVAPAGSDRPREPARPEFGSFNRRDQVYTREF